MARRAFCPICNEPIQNSGKNMVICPNCGETVWPFEEEIIKEKKKIKKPKKNKWLDQ